MINESDWIKGTHSTYGDDPTEWNGENRKCNLCEKDAEMHDEFCDEHQRCEFCAENDDCDCEEEMKLISACCGAKWDEDSHRCYHCKEWTESAWGEYLENK